MIAAEIPKDEAQRLAAVMQCGVLDTEPERDFDDLTSLASELLDVPIALVTLVDADRQWFKSRVGLDASESGRDAAFCSHAILGDDLFVVSDASKDERFHDNPFVTEPPHIRFYAGAPLRSEEGHAYGTLCVIDDRPRELSEKHAAILRGLARQATAQLELRRTNRELEAEMEIRREAERQLRDARRKADEANLAKSRFLANMSHEIRTPLGAIIGFTEQLALHDNNDKAQRREWLTTIQAASDHLLALVNDILDVSKIEARQMTLESLPTDVSELVTQSVNLLRPKARAKGLSLEVEFPSEAPTTIRTDPTRFRQVVVNLLSNAVKFTERGGVIIRTRLDTRNAAAPKLHLAVQDTGPGIDPRKIEKLFNAFAQAEEGTTRRHGGTGLGLHISRHICRQLGGDLTVESEVGRGSTFECILPAEPAEIDHRAETVPRDAPPTQARSASDTRCRVLIADDCDANRKLFGLILRRAGYEVAFAENGQQAIDACETAAEAGGHDLVLMDVQMPEVDGLDATRRLRARKDRRPIVALTADATAETRRRAEQAGCDAVLRKPLRSETLLDHLTRLLGRSGDPAQTAA